MKPSSTETYTSPIDLIITYVNGSDRSWISDYVKATKTHNPTAVRFRSWGTLRYLLRGVEAYMPFIRRVILVVAKKSQVPVWINRDTVRVVYHKDFIPEEFLPTFNSCTIESFFWRIPDLADRVIYLNDDMFPIDTTTEDDFFTGDIPHITFTEPCRYSARNIFRCQCRSSINMITHALELPDFDAGMIVRPGHISGVMTSTSLDAIGELCQDALPATISRLRLPRNVNQYIYAYYHYFTGTYINESVNYEYYEITEKTVAGIADDILQSKYQMACINDSDRIKDFPKVRQALLTCFEKKFPDMSKYEI